MILPSAPWGYSEEFFDEHKIDFIAHDDEPYTIGGGGVSGESLLHYVIYDSQLMTHNLQINCFSDTYALPKSKDMFCATERTEGISTSDIITRIVKVSNYRGD